MVGGREGHGVELHVGVLQARMGVGEGLHFTVMGGHHGRDTTLHQAGKDGLGEGGTLQGVGAGAQLIEQHQAIGRHGLEDLDDVAHVRAEGGERLLDALLIADIREHALEDREGGALSSGQG